MIIKKITIFLVKIQIRLTKYLWKLQSLPPFRSFPAYKTYFETIYNHYVIELAKLE